MQRLTEFLLLPCVPPRPSGVCEEGGVAISLQTACFAWTDSHTDTPVTERNESGGVSSGGERDAKEGGGMVVYNPLPPAPSSSSFELRDLSLSVGEGELVAVIGAVGSGVMLCYAVYVMICNMCAMMCL